MASQQQKNALLPAYLVVGPDELKRQTAITRLKARQDPSYAAFNLEEVEPGADLDPKALRTSLDTLPLGPTFRLVIVNHADHLPKAVSEMLVDYLANPNPGSVLMLVADSLARTTRLYKAVAKLGKTAVISCPAQKRWELPRQIVSRMAPRHGVSIDQAAAEELVSRVGESTVMIDTQLATLAELCRDKGHITLQDVEQHVARVAEVKPWDFLDAVCARDLRRALELYRQMRNPSQIALLSLLVGRVRELVCAKALDERGQGGALASELGKQQWQVKNHLRWARGFSMDELVGALGACASCERGLKGGADPETTFLALVVDICLSGDGSRR